MSVGKPTDLLTSRDIANERGWPVARADALIRAMARDGVTIHRIKGFRRIFVERGDLEARQSSGGST